MAIAFRSASATRTGSSSSVSSIVMTLGSATQTGNMVIVATLDVNSGTVSSVTDSGGSSYTKIASITNGTLVLELWSTTVTGSKASTTITVTWSAASRNHEMAACEYSGVAAIGTNNTASGSASPGSVSITTQDANNFVVAGIGVLAANAQTAQNGNLRLSITEAGAGNKSSLGEVDNTAASAGSVTDSTTFTSAAWGAVAVELRSASGNHPSVTATDTESFSDSAGENVTFSRSFSDTESFSDSASEKIAVSRSATDTASFSESLTRLAAMARSFSDSLSIGESVARTTAAPRTTSDSESFSDSLSGNRGVARTATDTASFSDSIGRALALKAVVSDTLSFSDSLARAVHAARVTSDSAAFSDAAARVTAASRTLSDSLSFSESLARILAMGRSSSDSLTFSESSGEHVALLRLISDAESFSDSLTGQSSGHGASVTATDSVSFSESLARLLNAARTLQDSFSFSESLKGNVALSRLANDSATLSESLTRLLALNPAPMDAFAFSEQLLAASSSTPRQEFSAMNWQLALREAPSDVSPDHIIGEFPSPMAIELDYQLAAGQAMGVVDTFLSPQTIPNNAAWAAGSYALTLVVQNGVSISFTIQLWRADASGTDIAQIGSQPAANVGPAVGPATFTFTVTDAAGQAATATERLKLKLLAQNTDGGAAHEFSILCSLSYLKTPIARLFEVTNTENTWRRGRFLGHFLRKGEHSTDFDKNGVDLHP